MRSTPRHGVQWLDAVALLEYRRANFADVIHQKYLLDPPRLSTVSFIRAMACWRLNDYWGAMLECSEGYELIQAGANHGLVRLGTTSKIFPGMSESAPLEGAWYDWAVAGLLMHECDEMLREADHSMDRIPGRAPSPENTALIRALGEWHALRGEWGQALERFDSVLQCNQKDTWDHATMDYLDGAISGLELSNESSYLRTREQAATRFNDTDDKSTAERLLKISLLRPIDGRATLSLEPFTGVLTRVSGPQKETNPYNAWYSMLLGLFDVPVRQLYQSHGLGPPKPRHCHGHRCPSQCHGPRHLGHVPAPAWKPFLSALRVGASEYPAPEWFRSRI